MTRAKVIQDKDEPVDRPVLAKAVGRPDIRAVLSSLKNLEKDYCR